MSILDELEAERYEIAKERCGQLELDIESSLKIIKLHQDFIDECKKHHAIESEFIGLCEKKIEIYSLIP